MWFAALPLAFLLFGQESVPTFRSEVSLVKVDLRVTDRSGSDISGLTARDFVVHDEGEKREIIDLASESERERVDIVLLLDVSGSMWRHLRDLSTTTSTALSQLAPGARVALMEFASKADVIEGFTSDYKLIERRIGESIFKQTLGRGTLINEALVAAANYLSRYSESAKRRAIIIVTDNEATVQAATDADVLRAIHSANAVLNGIVVGQKPDAPAEQTRSRFTDPGVGAPDVFRFASRTGGAAVTSDKPGEALRNTVTQVRTRYNLHYSAPQAERGKFRRIRVELTPEAAQRHAGAVVTAREGYYAAQ